MMNNFTNPKGTYFNILFKCLFFLLFFSATGVKAQVLITGDTAICKGGTAPYSVPSAAGNTYGWSVSGLGGIVGASNINPISINWDSAGTATVFVSVTNNFITTTGSLHVTIHLNPNPVITWPAYPTCPSSNNNSGNPNGGGSSGGQGHNSNPCINVCKNSTIVYSTPLDAGSTYVWVVSGANNFTGQGTNSVTVNWDSSSIGQIMVVETNQWGCVDSNTVCIQKVDVPTALFSTQSNICLNTADNFTNLSTGATSYQWYFGDGGSSTATNPSHSYAIAGTYTITLIAMNACHCSDTFRTTVTVNSEPGPDIECPSTVCAYDTQTYYTSAAGCNYNWIVSGGTIIAGANTSSITVAWGPGMLGTVSLYVTGCGNFCADTTTVEVPIIPSVATISGPIIVCPGDCHTYTLPPFAGGVFSWSISGTGMGAISSGGCNCCNGIEICWPSYVFSGNDTLNVSYFDSFLNCGGTGQLIIHLRPQLSLLGSAQACVNSPSSIYAFPGVNCNWSVSPSGPVITGNGSPNATINWVGMTGNFTVTAVAVNPFQTCNDSASTQIQVFAVPPSPVITGDTIVCPNSTNSYCSSSTNVSWIITGGTPATGNGSCINVQWGNTGPYMVQAIQQMSATPHCNSDTATQMVYPVPPASNPVITGVGTVCANGTNTFTNTTSYPPAANLSWSISPANAGSITGGQGTNTVTIQWGNNAPSSAIITLTVTVCSQTLTGNHPVNLLPAPAPTIVVNGTFCAGDSITLSATGGSYIGYHWTGPGAFNSTSNPSSYITQQGFYQVTVTDANNCTGNATKQVNYLPGPVANISTGDPTHYCIGATFSVQLNALANPNYTYNWSNGNTGDPISVSVGGTYVVTITDINGCTALSNAITITVDSCLTTTGDTGAPCVPNGSISFTHTGCNPVSFTNTSVNGNTFSWTFGDLGISGATNPTHTYALPGFYLVTLSGYVPNSASSDSCLLTDTAQLKVPLAPAFSFVAGCSTSPVCFTDLSTFTPGDNITSWSWNFGDSDTSTSQNPCHTYATGGTYIVTLTVGNGSCFSTVADTVVVLTQPVAAFTFSNPSCVNSNIPFTDLSTPAININSWNWSFGDAGTSLNQNPNHSYSSPGSYNVQLIVSNSFGCKDTASAIINIIAPSISGNITAYPDTIVCAGSSILLVGPACAGCTYAWSNTGTGDSITVSTTGTYSLTITDTHGCAVVYTINVVIKPAPSVAISNNGAAKFCLGSFTSLSGFSSPNYLYYWTSNDTINNGSTNSTISVIPSAAGVYYYILAVTDTTTGCSDTSLPYIITVNDTPSAPVITAIGPTTVCAGTPITLVVTHPASVSVQWNTGDITDTIIVTATGCYTATVTDSNGCTNSATICVTVNPMPETCAFWTGCLDTCNPFIIHGPSGDAYYQWLLNGVPIAGATSQNYTATVSGTYSLILTNSFGCTDTTGNLNLTLHACPNNACVDLIADTVYCDANGDYIFKYQIINNSGHTIQQENLQVLPPNVGMAYGPVTTTDSILNGDTSAVLTDTIYNMSAGTQVCFITHVIGTDTVGEILFNCNSDTACITLPKCNTCCNLNILSDSVWCTGNNAAGQPTYAYQLVISGCGNLTIQTIDGENSTTTNYTLATDSTLVINGSPTPTQISSGKLCFSFIMTSGNVICADTTICIPLPKCSNCCNLDIISDSVWCTGTNAAGLPTYGYQLIVSGCGKLILQTTSGKTIISTNGYTLTADSTEVIQGSLTLTQTTTKTICFTFVMENGTVICADTTICLPIPPCNNNCCYLDILSDSIWCTGTNPAGLPTYGYQIVLNGCGNLVLQTINGEDVTTTNYSLTADSILVISGSATPAQIAQGSLCFTFVMQGGAGVVCADTTICLPLPKCSNCCNFNIISDSVWCTGTNAVGLPTYGYQIVVNGCGNLVVQTTTGGTTTIGSTTSSDTAAINDKIVSDSAITANTGNYTLTSDSVELINGTFTGGSDTLLCLNLLIVNSDGLACADTTICVPLPPCNTNCCYLNILSDSVWCTGINPAGLQTYGYQVLVSGCGSLTVQSSDGEFTSTTNYTLAAGSDTLITGTFTSIPTINDSLLCLTFIMQGGGVVCADTTLCIPLPPCNSNCCYLNILSDSVWCTGVNPAGLQTYAFQVVVSGCGNLIIESDDDNIIVNSNYILTAGNDTVISGTFTEIPPVGSEICLAFVMLGSGGVACADTTICIPIPPCNSNCCYLNILSDSVWCAGTSINGGNTFGYQILVEGCGNLTVASNNGITTSYTLTSNITLITGTYTEPVGTEGIICLTFVMQGGGVVCADTTICLPLPKCQSNCCYLNILSDSVWCVASDIEGGTIYNYQVVVEGCGNLTVTSNNGITTSYILSSNTTVITGTYSEPQGTEGIICLTFVMQGGGVVCADTTICLPLPKCQSNCCYLNILSDSVWCAGISIEGGGNTFGYQVLVEGCGNLTVKSNTGVSTTYTLSSNTTLITGSYTEPQGTEGIICLTFVMQGGGVVCADTTICLPLPKCKTPPPCNLKFPKYICVGQSAVFSYAGDTTGYTFNWSFTNGTPSTATGPGPHSVIYTSIGCFPVTLTITDGEQEYVCHDTICVVAYPIATITPASSTILCQGGSVVLVAGGGTDYVWSNDEDTSEVVTETSGIYTVTVTNIYGCLTTATITVSVNPNPVPVITTSGATTFCTGDSVILDAGSYNSYLWNNGATTEKITVYSSGVYSVTVSDTNGCSGTSTISVKVNSNPSPLITANGATKFCQGDSVTLDAGTYSGYIWNNEANTETITVYSTGTYIVTVSDTNGCSGTAAISVKVYPNPSPVIKSNGETTFCDGGSVTLDAGSYNGYIWNNGDTSETITVYSSGTYTVTVTDANGCTGTASQTVTVNPVPIVGITGVTTACGSVTLTATGGGSYSWSGGNSPNTAINTFTSSGTYTVTVTNSYKCTATASDSVTIKAVPIAGITGNTKGCKSVTLKATGGGTYSWSGGSTPTTAGNTFTSSGIYTVTVTGADGCTATASDTVVVSPVPTASITGTATGCGSVTLTASGGTTYAWSGGNSLVTATNTFTVSGTYTVTVTNAGGCTATTSQKVTINPVPAAAITGVDTGCGKVTLKATGGGTYLWNGGSTPTTAGNTFTSSGIYTVTVTGADGCTATASDTVIVNPIPIVNITGITTGCGSVTLTATGGGTYEWNGGSSPGSATNTFTSSGTYTVTVTNSSGCTATASQKVTVNPIPTAGITGITTGCGKVTLKATGGGTYLWNGGSTPTTAGNTFTSSGIYTVTVTGADGCTATASDTVIVNPIPIVNITGITTGCGSVTLTATGGGTYEWNGGSSSGSATNTFTSSGTYTVTVTNSYGCTATASQKVNVNPIPNANITGTTTACGSVTLKATGGSTYAWSGGSSPLSATNTFSSSGTYTVTVTNSSGCTATASARVVVDSVPVQPGPITGPTNVCKTQTADVYSITPVAGATSYSWSITDGGVFVGATTGTSVTVSYTGAAVGTAKISVKAVNVCGASTASILTITVTATCSTLKDDETDNPKDDNRQSTTTGETDIPAGLNADGFMVKVYPNPFSNTFHLRVESSSDENLQLKIYNTLGQLIERKTTESYYGTDITLGNNIAGGVYFLEVQQGENKKVLRIVKSE